MTSEDLLIMIRQPEVYKFDEFIGATMDRSTFPL